MTEPLNPDAYAFITLQREYRSQMDRHAALRAQERKLRDDLERVEAKALTASERATSIMESLLKWPSDAARCGTNFEPENGNVECSLCGRLLHAECTLSQDTEA